MRYERTLNSVEARCSLVSLYSAWLLWSGSSLGSNLKLLLNLSSPVIRLNPSAEEISLLEGNLMRTQRIRALRISEATARSPKPSYRCRFSCLTRKKALCVVYNACVANITCGFRPTSAYASPTWRRQPTGAPQWRQAVGSQVIIFIFELKTCPYIGRICLRYARA